jgi:hypothetical protein
MACISVILLSFFFLIVYKMFAQVIFCLGSNWNVSIMPRASIIPIILLGDILALILPFG